ncbi:MAG: porin [Proteobacteria bacterium]|nr:porin [Pseudomonadota bacterium]
MKKRLLAVGLASVFAAGTAAAQNLTVYGLVDGGYLLNKGTDGTNTQSQGTVGGVQSANGSGTLSGSRLGFRATEDLGGGTRLTLVLENGVNFTSPVDQKTVAAATATPATNGQQILSANTRAAYVDVAFATSGSVRIGTQDSIQKLITDSYDVGGCTSLTGACNFYQGILPTTRPGDAVIYTAPELAPGLGVKLGYYLSGNASSQTIVSNGSTSAFSLEYKIGGLSAALAQEKTTNMYRAVTYAIFDSYYDINATNAAGLVKTTGQAINFAYDMGGGVKFTWINASNQDSNATTSASKVKLASNTAGAMYSVGPNTFRANLTRGKVLRGDVSSDVKTSGYQLIATHDLSKRTNLYFAMGQSYYDVRDNTTDAKLTQTAVGLRHSF